MESMEGTGVYFKEGRDAGLLVDITTTAEASTKASP